MNARHMPVRVVSIVGSLRADSYNRKLLRAATELSPQNLELVAWNGLKQVPPFDEDDEHAPTHAVLDLRRAIADADVLLLITPEYNGSLPGALKNAVDWASRPRENAVLRGKPVAVAGVSPSPSGARSAQADARRVLARAGALVLEPTVAVPAAYQRFGTDGALTDAAIRAQLREFLTDIANSALSAAPIAA